MRRALALLLLLAAAGAAADDRLALTGELDVRLVHATGVTSFLDGGAGVLRFDPEHEGVRLGRAFLAARLRLLDTLTLHTVADAYGDHDRHPLDLSEAWLEWRPFPVSAVRLRGRFGAFYLPASLENRGPGWSDVYTITPSAIDSWFGEELRTLGAELEARWLGASRGYPGDVGLVAAAYRGNDPAGVVLATRGFGLSDRPSTLAGGLGRPPLTVIHEIDGRTGYYAGLSWHHAGRLELSLLRYDNRADPGAVSSAGAAWATRFVAAGARLEPDAHWTLLAQLLDGDTLVGPGSAPDDQFRMDFRAFDLLASRTLGRARLTLRYDDFRTRQRSGFYGPPADESGHAFTLGAGAMLGEHWQAALEWIRVTSTFPPRTLLGVAPALVESQLQLALRCRLRGSW